MMGQDKGSKYETRLFEKVKVDLTSEQSSLTSLKGIDPNFSAKLDKQAEGYE